MLAPLARAAPISSSHNYAWSNTGGWVNFAPTNGGVSVTNSALSGYAWSANDGWINFSPSTSGVTNDGKGNLSGFAWDATAGWVAFSGVTIDSSGRFHGQATGANGYVITFNCTQCDVETIWRPSTATTQVSAGGGGGAVSGPLSVGYVQDSNNSAITQSSVPTEPTTPPPSAPSSAPIGVSHSAYHAQSNQGQPAPAPMFSQTIPAVHTPSVSALANTASSTMTRVSVFGFVRATVHTVTAGIVSLLAHLFSLFGLRW